MQPPEQSEGWLAQLVYIGVLGCSGALAWLSRYLSGRKSEEEDRGRYKHLVRDPSDDQDHYAILQSAELTDMRAVRAVLPELRSVGAKLDDVLQITHKIERVVEDNHRIVEQNREMLLILQKIDRAMDVEEEVKGMLRQQQIEAILRANQKAQER